MRVSSTKSTTKTIRTTFTESFFRGFSQTHEKKKKKKKKNVVTYTAIISGLSKDGRRDEAFRLYDEMKQADLTPDDRDLLPKATLGYQSFNGVKYIQTVNRAKARTEVVQTRGKNQQRNKKKEMPKELNIIELELRGCPNLTSFPEGIQGLTSLKYLEIAKCPNLTSFPEGIRSLTSLNHVRISDSLMLLKRCKKEVGEDWDKISHIQLLNLFPDPNKEDFEDTNNRQDPRSLIRVKAIKQVSKLRNINQELKEVFKDY
ncbi:hypothetical protein G4B88_026872 [Cannabis sativa]|uniref:Uncharacterized protein n=1 Tax=Cannabis sativa TaxID=3483 RepID=A0A7J6EB61_CANSA|nr:hypothetical protein G4B88_026872 [Cannabis sativa]